MKDKIRSIVLAAGACRVGFARADVVDSDEIAKLDHWLAASHHADMSYMERNGDLRIDPRRLFEGTHTVISCAFDYRRHEHHPLFSDYATGDDYHEVIRQRLTAAAEAICSRFGGSTRICVDSAPVRERYWAVMAGLGYTGLNGQLIIDGIGSKVFLAEILWTGIVEPDTPMATTSCLECGECIKACPGAALDGRGGVDARRCLSYLTIEHRGPLPDGVTLDGRIYGCDVCQDVCPLCRDGQEGITTVAELQPRADVMAVTLDSIVNMRQEDFSRIFTHSPIKRTKLPGLLRNAAAKNSIN